MLTVEPFMKRVFRVVLFCPLNRGGKGTGFVGSRKTTENPVTRFPVEKSGAAG